MSSSRAKKVKMATKSCPDCDQQATETESKAKTRLSPDVWCLHDCSCLPHGFPDTYKDSTTEPQKTPK